MAIMLVIFFCGLESAPLAIPISWNSGMRKYLNSFCTMSLCSSRVRNGQAGNRQEGTARLNSALHLWGAHRGGLWLVCTLRDVFLYMYLWVHDQGTERSSKERGKSSKFVCWLLISEWFPSELYVGQFYPGKRLQDNSIALLRTCQKWPTLVTKFCSAFRRA